MSPNENWYGHLVAQSRNDNIYTLIHNYLVPHWEPNHDFDFVVVRKTALPEKLQPIPSSHISKKLPPGKYCFPGNDYVLLHNYHLTEYLYHAEWAKVIEDFEEREYIELRYDWTEEAKHLNHYPPAYFGNVPMPNRKPDVMPIQLEAPQTEEEEALLVAYRLLQKGVSKEEAMKYAEAGKSFLDAQEVTVSGDSAEALQQVARRMMGYNIVAMVYAWNNQINKAAAIDEMYIHHPPMWDYLEEYIQPYLEMLIVKKQTDYLQFLFKDVEFRKRFLPHYEAYISLLVDDTYEMTRMGQVVNIINRVNNATTYK